MSLENDSFNKIYFRDFFKYENTRNTLSAKEAGSLFIHCLLCILNYYLNIESFLTNDPNQMLMKASEALVGVICS